MDCGEDGTGAGTPDLGTALGGGADGPPFRGWCCPRLALTVDVSPQGCSKST